VEQSYLRNKKKNATDAELIQEILHLAAESGRRLGGASQDTYGAAQFFFTEVGEWCRITKNKNAIYVDGIAFLPTGCAGVSGTIKTMDGTEYVLINIVRTRASAAGFWWSPFVRGSGHGPCGLRCRA